MIKFRIDAARGPEIETFEHIYGSEHYTVREQVVHDAVYHEDNSMFTCNLPLCDCPVQMRGKVCDHLGHIMEEAKLVDFHHRPVGIWIYEEPRLIIPVNLTISNSISVFNCVGEDEVVSVLSPKDTLNRVRRKLIEWMSSLPYTMTAAACTSHYHATGRSPFEHPEDYLDEKGNFSRHVLMDFYQLYSTRVCRACTEIQSNADYDDRHKII